MRLLALLGVLAVTAAACQLPMRSSDMDVGGVYEAIAFGDIRAGDRSRVEVWFTGPATRSLPPQAEASAILYWRLAP